MSRGQIVRIRNRRYVMQRPSRWPIAMMVMLVLGACGGQDPDPETAPESLPTRSALTPRSAPAETSPGPVNPAPTTIDSDSTPEALQQARAERDRLRQRIPRESLHWDEQAMREKLGIDADQFQTLQQARQALLQERVTVRAGLQAQRHFQAQAEAAGDSARLAEIEARNGQLRAQLDTAKQTWQDTLNSVLDADQLQRWREQP